MKISICGVGTTGVGKFVDRSVVSLASEALSQALDDAGMVPRDVDGLISHIGSPRGIDYDLVASRLGLSVGFAAQPWSHGRFGATVLQHAAMAIHAGMASTVVCLAAYRNTPLGRIGERSHFAFEESMRDGGGAHGETPHAGYNGPVAAAAMAASRYFHKYAVPIERLAAVPMAMRRHANLNPGAAMYAKTMDLKTYTAAPFIVEPLRLLDCSVVVDGAVAIIMTTDQRANDAPAKPVRIAGMQGISAGPNHFIFGQPGLGVSETGNFEFHPLGREERVYKQAGLSPGDVDFLQCYDAFSPLVLFSLERFGFCQPGEAAEWVQDGRIELGGELPVNTSGGMLSEGHLNGWTQFVETVRQLRGECGDRQVADAKIGQWGTSLGDALIFARADVLEGR